MREKEMTMDTRVRRRPRGTLKTALPKAADPPTFR